MKLSKKLILSFISLIIVSITIISLTSNAMINRRFENYLITEREDKFENIYKVINELYVNSNFKLDPMELKHYALSEDINIIIQDMQGNILYNSSTGMGMGRMGRMGGMHHGGMNHMMNIPQGEYVEKVYKLLHDNNIVGSLIIGYIDNAYLTESAILFKNTLGKSFIISGLITIFIGILVSIFLSNRLTTPLINIRNTANEIQSGNLNAKSIVNTNIKEILDLSSSINYLGGTLSQQENIRKRYASDISHELRTPLTTLKTHIEAIIDGIWEPTKEHLDILMSEITRLSNLVDDLRDSFNAEEYNINLKKTRFNISEELENIITSFIPIYSQKGYNISQYIEKNIEVFMDIDKFKQIINNLLTNAFHYLGKDGKVSIKLTKLNNKLNLSIEDNGIGIKEENLPLIFDRFYRADTSRNKTTGGTGLGLSIVKSIVEAHGGNIYIKSQYGKGTKVVMNFPLE